MSGFWRKRGWPGLLALALAVAGAAGLGPWLGGGARIVQVVDLSPSCQPPATIAGDAVELTDSDLGAGLRRAAARDPDRILLVTDGVDRSGEAPAPPPGIPVDVVLQARRDDVGILEIRLPERIPAGIPFSVAVVIGRTAGPGAEAVEARVSLTRNGERVGGIRAVRLRRGQTRLVRIADRVAVEGIVRYRARLAAPGPPGNDVAEAVARIGRDPLVLAIGTPPELGRKFTVVAKRPEEIEGLLTGPEVAARFDAILLDAVHGASPACQARIVAAVRGGAGLVVLGGAGFAGQPLEQILPLTDAPPEGRAAVLLLDYSGSMYRLKEKLIAAVDRLREHFAPDDKVACVIFRGEVVMSSGWSRAADARWDLSARPHGETRLAPALREAQRLLREVGQARRRVFVVSDGAWLDKPPTVVPELLEELKSEGIFRAALFVEDKMPVDAPFDVKLKAGDDLGAGLKALEDAAPDRFVKVASATRTPAPAWLEAAVPPAGTYRDFPRLWGRNRGEAIPLSAGEIPLVGAWRRPGKVVVCAPRVDPRGLVRACLREESGLRLRVRREGGAVTIEVRGGTGAEEVRLGKRVVEARPVAPGVRRARVDNGAEAGGEARVATCGAAVALVPPASGVELAGLSPRRDIAAAIAARSGGKLYEAMPALDRATSRPAVFVTLLVAALLVLVSALRRRRT